jgi:arylsulfatase A-like enzyme
MAAMVDRLSFEEDRPAFYLLNVGETHYPYALPDEDPGRWPRISGVHGVFRRLDAEREGEASPTEPREFFDQSQLRELQARQITAVEYLDGVFARLFDRLPADTWVIVTSDHGELFGEDRYFGHGPISHPKVFEVPFVEGVTP